VYQGCFPMSDREAAPSVDLPAVVVHDSEGNTRDLNGGGSLVSGLQGLAMWWLTEADDHRRCRRPTGATRLGPATANGVLLGNR
jgi:hypothetical protein